MKIKNIINVSILIVCCSVTTACNNFLSIDAPDDQIVTEMVFTNDETATSSIRGIYAQMMTTTGFAGGGNSSVTVLAGRTADEFVNYSATTNYSVFSQNNILPENIILKAGLWTQVYKYTYYSNAILENLDKPTAISEPVKQQLRGEARFIRAFCYFYLTNLFGNIPLVLSTDYRINSIASSSTADKVYEQIIKDLTDAKALLASDYPSAERVRPNKWAATALLARAFLFQKKWAEAELNATEVIANSDTYKVLDDLNQVFLKNSLEAIWQLYLPAINNLNTNEGRLFILIAPPSSSDHVGLSPDLLAAFEAGDQRLSKWVGTFKSGTSTWSFPYKYKVRTGGSPRTEYTMVLRLAEQYLIRSEARAMQNNFEGARDDINVIRKRAGLLNVTYNTQTELLSAIEKERRIELFSEWGHRWFDLKRTNRADAVLGPIKSPNWQSADVLYPIPASEILNNPNLSQNKGY